MVKLREENLANWLVVFPYITYKPETEPFCFPLGNQAVNFAWKLCPVNFLVFSDNQTPANLNFEVYFLSLMLVWYLFSMSLSVSYSWRYRSFVQRLFKRSKPSGVYSGSRFTRWALFESHTLIDLIHDARRFSTCSDGIKAAIKQCHLVFKQVIKFANTRNRGRFCPFFL